VTLASLALLLAAPAAGRQDEPPPAPVRKAPSTLFVLVHVRNKNLDADTVKNTFKVAAQKLGDADVDIRIDVLEPQFYRRLQSLAATLDSPRTSEAVPGKPFVRQIGSRGDRIEWELNLNRGDKAPRMLVTAVDLISTGKDGKTTKRTIRPTRYRDLKAEMSGTADPGVFHVRLSATEAPVKFVVHGETVKGKAILPAPEGDWAQTERYYVVVVRNLRADHQALLTKVQDPNEVADPLDDAVIDQGLTFVFASYGFKLPGIGTFDGNDYVPFLTRLEGRTVARVWMLFPLTEKEAERQLKRYARLGPQALSKAIRATDPVWAAGKQPVVSDTSPPRWIELPPKFGKDLVGRPPVIGYSQRITLENVRALAKKYPRARRLVVYEFQPRPTDEPQAVLFEGSSGGSVRVTSEEVKEWAAGIAGVAAKAPKEEGKKKSP
jgi:hypothetical protein